ncbi:MAG: hypothetical protein A3J55_04335 [Candidatus Ryanbacteria bacterium RIFCSPHIGHO2_02_FULL_45_17b]|uniref:Uncharacterized protein n=1 Tax=Candidatus Ryanbacteria bacterium RIFCSPHIGHO2_01_FULL_45_22 TaxID=1802114 RepID=A0A1G2G386_9BACT|nr:MAG: hypothetical protein A2719_04910 [Candidatus Ryanbacteria bacterium RIFCSPHIGHO2_01_FULL_45_22]OGZ47574.1 MAG: hypothetical protein A3J55_04335 [Candidatus Ryanbacteria bacterium RIFCSPHIGHO2_02_FULL_45_17b]
MDKKQVLIGIERDLMDVTMVYQALNDVFDVGYDFSECARGMDVVTRAMYANHFGRPFELLIFSDFRNATGRSIHQELNLGEVVGMIRSMRAYEKTPLMLVSDYYLDFPYKNLGVSVWVELRANREEWENAIQSAVGEESDNRSNAWYKIPLG